MRNYFIVVALASWLFLSSSVSSSGSIWPGSNSGTYHRNNEDDPCEGRRSPDATSPFCCSSCGTYFWRSAACSDGHKWKANSSARDSARFLASLHGHTSSRVPAAERRPPNPGRRAWCQCVRLELSCLAHLHQTGWSCRSYSACQ